VKRHWRWTGIAAGGCVLALLAAWAAFVNALSGDSVRIARAVELPSDFVLLNDSSGGSVRAEKAFFASAHGGWHGDGSEMTAYKIRSADVATLLAGLKAKHPDYRWGERLALYSTIAYLAAQIPAEFRPGENARLWHGEPQLEEAAQEYYFDRQLEVLFVVNHRF
jgi:hypothetical protein